MTSLDKIRRILGSKLVFENRWVRIREKLIEIGQRSADTYYVIEGSERLVSMLGVDENSNLLLVEQYRFAMDAVSIDIPGGAVDEGETPAQAAAREFEEETGFIPAKVEQLGEIFCDSGQKDSRRWFFLGTELSPSAKGLKCDETLRLIRSPLDQVFNEVLCGKYNEPNLIVALSLAAGRLGLFKA